MEVTHPNYSLAKSKEEIVEEELNNPLPRAVLRSTSHLLLDGEWKFAVDQEDQGLQGGWHLGHEYRGNAHWPGSIEVHMAAAKGEKALASWQDKVVAWYEREFILPQEPFESDHTMWQLTFGACGYETQVWLNGLPLRTIEGEEVNVGEYTSFSYELNEEQLKPVNRISVRIADNMEPDIPRGKQESHVYKRGGIWY